MPSPSPTTCDVAILGAGPAGSAAAILLARRGLRVVLLDKAAFPRDKVCGCCVNFAALDLLHRMNLGDMLGRLGGRPTTLFRLRTGRAISTLPLPGGVAVSRRAFDQALVDEAISAGAEFHDRTSVQSIEPSGPRDEARTIHLTREAVAQSIRAKIVLVCTGLDGRLLESEPGMNARIARRSHMGVSAVAAEAPDAYEPGVIHMIHGKGGYVGLVRLETGALDIAAALSPSFVKSRGGPSHAVAALLASAHQPAIPLLLDLDWRGTPLLTRHRDRVASHRLFALGDAASYVEPFTGEGIAWALASAHAAAPIAARAIDNWLPAHAEAWDEAHRLALGSRQRRCRWMSRGLRCGPLVGVVNRVLRLLPAVARPFVAALSAPWNQAALAGGALSQGEAS